MIVGLLPEPPLLTAFLGASLVLAVTPGPGVIYIVVRSITCGRRYGLASVVGVAAGNLCSALAASIGLAAVFAVSSVAFMIVKWAGVAYLVYLGIRAIRGAPMPRSQAHIGALPALTVVRDAFVVAVLNPKTALFFAAFLPQFMTPEADPTAQAIALGAAFVGIAVITDSVYAIAAGSVSWLLASRRSLPRIGRVFSGSTLIGLAIYSALSDDCKHPIRCDR
jgi:threonine/homoserine/homoserine lactone efflux protein